MKPGFIFSAVAAVCLLMIAFLPRLATPSQAAPPQASAQQEAAALQAAFAEATTAPPLSEAPPLPLAPPLPVAPVPDEEMIVPTPTSPPVSAVEEVLPVFNPPAAPVAAQAQPAALPELDAFSASLVNGQPNMVVGFYAAGLFALPVMQQPNNDANFISDQDGTVTQFSRPSQYSAVGLLAHNTLSGKQFFHLSLGQEIHLIYGDGRAAEFRISDIQSYQALSPYDTHSDFVDLNRADAPLLNHSQLFQRVYTTPGKLVLQTCIEANGEPTWGRVFIVADPV